MIKWLLPTLVAALAFGYFYYSSQHYPWQLALLSGLSIGALTYVVQRTIDQMVSMVREPSLEVERTIGLTPEDDGEAEGAPERQGKTTSARGSKP